MFASNKWLKSLVLACTVFCFVTALSSVGVAQSGSAGAATAVAPQKKAENTPVKLSARFHVEKGKTKGFLIVRAEIKKGSYIYGLSQKKPLIPTKMVATKTPEIKSFGAFKAVSYTHLTLPTKA